MRYKHLYANKWLDTEPEKLYSDGIDEEELKSTGAIRIVLNKYKYPEEYRDVIYTKDESFKSDMFNDPLFYGFHNILISDKNPNEREVIAG